MRMIALGLRVLGVLGLAYGGFSNTRKTHETQIGPLEIAVQDKESVSVPLWAGVLAIAAGASLLVFGDPTRRTR